MARKLKKWTIGDHGNVEECSSFGFDCVCEASNKGEATRIMLKRFKNHFDRTPEIKFKNGAYQFSFASATDDGFTVCSGIIGRESLCIGNELSYYAINENSACFGYYASEEFQNAQ